MDLRPPPTHSSAGATIPGRDRMVSTFRQHGADKCVGCETCLIRKASYRNYYGASTRRVVEELYKGDLEVFYEF